MAINKRKILQSAQKHMQKGALDKALKDYLSLLKADPRDTNVRLKVGDIHLKQGQTNEAVAAYQKVAEHFMREGFDAKAVALYKQITKIDPKRVEIYEPLAELYQRLGLTPDAMAALQTAADAHYRAGAKTEALDLLRKMASLDPSNTTNRIKVADLLRQEGREEEAIAEYEAIGQELERQGNAEERCRVLERILEIDPDRCETLQQSVRCRLESRELAKAEAIALAYVEKHPEDLQAHRLLAEVVEAAGKVGSHVAHFRKLAEMLKARGEEGEARTVMQHFVSSEAFGDSAVADSDLETDDRLEIDGRDTPGPFEMDPAGFEDPAFGGEEGLRLGDPIAGLSKEPDAEGDESSDTTGSLPSLPRLNLEAAGTEEPPRPEDGAATEPIDPEQLLAEAGVYLRYGKHARAIDTLRGLLAQHPQHGEALARLGEALLAVGEQEAARDALAQAGEQARQHGDAELLAGVREQIARIDPEAAEQLAPPADAPSGIPTEGDASQASPARARSEPDIEILESDDGLDLELDLGESPHGFDVGATEGSQTASPEGPAPAPSAAAEEAVALPSAEERTSDAREAGEEGDLFFEIDADAQASEALGAPAADPPEARDPGQTATLESGDFDFDLEVEVEPADTSEDEQAAPEESTRGGELSGTSSSTTPDQIVEELEEADFYFQQGMHAEARAIYARILQVAPHHPQALLRLGEIDAEEHGDADSGAPRPWDGSTPESTEAEDALSAGAGDEGLEAARDDFEDLDFDVQEEPPGDASVPAGPDVTAPFGESSPSSGSSADPEQALEDESAEEAGARVFPELDDSGNDSGDFDLAAELAGAFQEEDPLGESGSRRGTTEEEGFEEVFAAFKAGVRQQLGEGDSEAHYDLGIAYKEMGLLEDAIGEFSLAVSSPAHRLACLHMMALCAFDLGRFGDAVAHLEQALSGGEIPRDQQVALHFDLGRAYAAAGEIERARDALRTVQSIDPEFRDVEQQLEALDSCDPVGPDPSDEEQETFESFDDLMAETEAEASPGGDREPPGEAFESFDDLLEDEGEEAASAQHDEPSAAEPGGPASGGASSQEERGPTRGRRRRKISFV